MSELAHAAPLPVPAPHTPRRKVHRRSVSAASIGASLALHGALLTLGAIVVYQAASSDRASSREVTVSFDSPGQGAALPGAAAGSVTHAVTLNLEPPGGRADPVPAPTEPAPASLLTGLSSTEPRAVAAAARSGPGSALEDLFSATGDAASPATAGETVTFAGLGASSARSVVYAVDCSGPMVTSLPLVLAEVRRSISRLSPTQKFGVILFRSSGGRPAMDAFAPVLVRATPSARARLETWLGSAEPTGKSSPLAGLEAALALRPDAVFLLSRAIDRSGGGAWEGGLAPTMARLDQLNPSDPSGRRPVVIQTIQFLDEDPTGTLQAIGTQHGTGTTGYRVIKRGEDLSSR